MADPWRVLVTGATGTLGREVVAALDDRRGVVVRSASRGSRPADETGRHEWRTVDLTGDPLGPVLDGCDTIVHLASGKGSGDADVRVTERLLEAATAERVRHVVVVSILGSDRIPLPFYTSKRRIEALVRASRVPWSIVRIAQFHSFVERLVATPVGLPLPQPIVADLRFQPVDEREAAEALVDVTLGPPRGEAPEVAGPEVLTLGEIAATWLRVTRSPARLLPVTLEAVAGALMPEPAIADWALPTLEGYRAAENVPTGERLLGRVTFEEWLRRRTGQ
ncbi:MAG TPA: NAD(P)H-binding protein [Candidatus Limnocylindrales bacterium]